MRTVNKNVDAEFYYNLFSQPRGVFDQIEKKMPWLRHGTVLVQQDGALPHTGQDNVNDLEMAGTGEGWTVKIITQPAQSPDLNCNDLGFFHSLKTKVQEENCHVSDRDEMIKLVEEQFKSYKAETLDGIWACFFNNCRSILRLDGGNQYKSVHNQGLKRAKMTGTKVDLNVDENLVAACKNKFYGLRRPNSYYF
jgi:hypothetical protein